MLDDMSRAYPDDPALLLARAVVLLDSTDQSDVDRAIALLETAVTQDPHLISAHDLLIRLAFARDDFDRVKDLVQRALSKNPEEVGLMLTQAKIDRHLEDHARARRVVFAVLRKDPRNLDATYLAAQIAYFDFHDFEGADGAIELIDSAVRLNPSRAEIQQLRAEIYAKGGKMASAITGLEAFAAANPEQADAKMLTMLARFNRAQENFEASRKWIAQAQDRFPDAGEVVRVRMLLLAGEKDHPNRYDELVALVLKRQASHPDDADSLYFGASLLLPAQEERIRRQVYSMFVSVGKIMPDRIEGFLGAARTAYVLDDHAAALEAFRRVHELYPNHAEALNGIAWILFEQGGEDLTEALEHANTAVTLQPDQASFRDTRANILLAREDFAGAKRDFARSEEMSALNSELRATALIGLARAAIGLGQYEDADKALKTLDILDRRHGVLNADQRAEVQALTQTVSEH